MLLYPFDYPDMRGDVEITLYEGVARIARCDVNGWHITGITLRGCKKDGSDAEIALAKDDPLYTPIALHLQKTEYAEIGAWWAEHVREQNAEKEVA